MDRSGTGSSSTKEPPLATLGRAATPLDRSANRSSLDDVVADTIPHEFINDSPFVFTITDLDGTIVDVNASAEGVLGQSRRELIGQTIWSYLRSTPPSHLSTVNNGRHAMEEIETLSGEAHETVNRIRAAIESDLFAHGEGQRRVTTHRPDGSTQSIHWMFRWDPKLNRCYSIGRDITEEMERQRRLIQSDRFLSISGDLFVVFDTNGAVLRVNNAAAGLVAGGSNSTMSEVIHEDDRASARNAAAAAISEGESRWTGRVIRGDGTQTIVDTTLVWDEAEKVVVLVGRDVTEESMLKAALSHRANTDGLTGLANRRLIVEKLDRAIEVGRPAVLFCDLDRFRVINESLGYDAGDELLRLFGRRLRNLSVSRDVTIARIGGDEFVVLLESADRHEAMRLARSVQSVVANPFVVNRHKLYVDMSVGISFCAEPSAVTSADLLGAADIAVNRAKAQGRGHIVLFDDAVQQATRARFEGEAALRRALDERRVHPYFQPVVRLSDETIVGGECLVRINRPDGSIISPGEFMPIAEEVGLVGLMDDRMLSEAMQAFRGFPMPFRVALNSIPSQLRDPAFPERVAELAAVHSFDLKMLSIELTEGSVLEDVTSTTRNLERLRSWGVHVALDDFGTGYSSLSHVRTLPIDSIKIDRSFTAEFLDDAASRALIEGVIQLCRALDLGVIAEGVETAEQADALRDMGCTEAQGFYFFRPMPITEFRAMTDRANRA